jgi:hypothetical protein
MKTSVTHVFKLPMQELLAQYSSQQFYLDRFELDGVEDFVITHFEENDLTSVLEMERHFEIRTNSLPKFIKKVIDNMAGDSASVIVKVNWNKKTGAGSNVIEPKGIPVTIFINFQLSEKSKTQCLARVDISIKAKIPIVGKQLEKFALPKAEKAIKKDLQRTEDFLLQKK